MKKSRALMILLTVLLLFGMIPVNVVTANATEYSVSTYIDGVNVPRLTDFMVIYNHCGDYTYTNEWGYEVVVTSGVVTAVGGNNSYIPEEENSFVISGHGVSVNWLKENVVIGMKASYDQWELTFTYDKETTLINLETGYNDLLDKFGLALQNYRIIDYDIISAGIDKIALDYNEVVSAYEADNSYDVEAAAAPIIKEIEELSYLCTESASVEIRGVWIRPTQTTAAQVEEYVGQLYDAGINMVCIETLYNSTMIMPMPKDSLFEQNPEWKGFDMLQAFIDACHKRDMELHVWMPVYYVGHGNSSNYSKSVGAKKPEWLSLTNTGEYYAPEDWNRYMFLSPANPEVKDFLLGTYEYILLNYDIDGFQLDYIRYTDRSSVDFGYDEATLNAFKAEYGIKPSYDTGASYWNNWVAFRADCVTDMVRSVRELVNRIRPQAVLSADVGADLSYAYSNLYQDSKKWLREGLLDMIHPMAYGEGYVAMMDSLLAITGNCYVGVGLGAFVTEFDASDMLRQAAAMAKIKADGSVFFEAGSYLSKGIGDLLTSSLYRNRALSPAYDERMSVALLIQQAKTRIEQVILPHEGITSAQAVDIITLLDAATATVSESLTNQTVIAINNAIAVVNTMNNSSARRALLDDLRYAERIAVNGLNVFNIVSDYFAEVTAGGDTIALGFSPGTVQSMTAAEAKTLLGGNTFVLDRNGKSLSDGEKIGTGCVLSNGKFTYTVIIKGDINGDGVINSADYLISKRIFLGTYEADQYQTKAAAITDGVAVKAADYLRIKRHFLGSYDIFSIE